MGLDPVAGLAWLMATAGGGSMIDVLHWACVGWLLVFATGAIALSRRVTDDPWILTGIYGYILLGPIWLAMPAQSYGFLLPFRYLPWVLLSLIRLIERPTHLGGLGLGIVGGLSLAGYQALYAVPVVVVFATTYVLVRFFHGLRPQRAHLWAALSVLLAFLPVALPTGVALLYASTDLYVVARTHYQGRYAFSASALLLDLLGPLTPSPQSWHGAFSLGPGLLFFSLLGPGVLLLQSRLASTGGLRSSEPDQIPGEARILGHERTALSVAWLATTGTAIILATGPASDRLLLGLRNWGFLLTVALLGATQLTVAAAEVGRRWLEAPGASPRRPLSLAAALIGLTAVIIVGLCVALWANADVARECMVRFLCDRSGGLTQGYLAGMALGFAPLLAVLLLAALFPPDGAAGKRRVRSYGVAFLGMVTWHLIVTLHAGPLGGQALAIPTAGRTPPRAPGLEMVEPDLPVVREELFDIRPFVPFHYEGPALWHRAAARMLPVAFAYSPLSYPVTPITHVFRFWRYQALISAGLDRTIEDRVLAATAPPLRLATKVFEARDLKEALELLARADTTEASAVVVEAAGRDLQDFVRLAPAETRDETGSVRVERYSAAAIRLRVRTPRPALLVYADGYDPEWLAFVDGRSVPVYPANVIGKAVPVPAGDSLVELVYRPWLYIVAFWLRALALLVACGVALGLPVYWFGLRRSA